MNNKILDHYLQFSVYTNPGLYIGYFKSLPDNVSEIGNLVCHQIIHRVTLKEGNTNANRDKRYGDMDRYPWRRLRCEDDILMTSVSMTAELFRLDGKGFYKERLAENKIVVGCRYVAVLISSILKAKGIPCRARAGFGPYFGDESRDHWINQYWDYTKNKRINIDADGFFDFLTFDQYDLPDKEFDRAGKSWLNIRSGKVDEKRFVYADNKTNGLKAAIRAIFYDFHALMNNEISYEFQPSYVDKKFDKLTEENFKEIDELANLLLDPDKNFDKLLGIWNTKRKFRILNSPLVSDSSHA